MFLETLVSAAVAQGVNIYELAAFAAIIATLLVSFQIAGYVATFRWRTFVRSLGIWLIFVAVMAVTALITLSLLQPP